MNLGSPSVNQKSLLPCPNRYDKTVTLRPAQDKPTIQSYRETNPTSNT